MKFEADKEYWKQYYNKHKVPGAPSSFAEYVLPKYMRPDKHLVELGCGNGRDAIFFGGNNLQVSALEQCENEVAFLNKHYAKEKLRFYSDDFTSPQTKFTQSFDYVYSRFTFHSITEEAEESAIDWILDSLTPGGMFFLEARSTLDPICGQGEQTGKNTYFFNHHNRRFLEYDEFIAKTKLRFDIVDSVLSSGLAVCGDDDPVLIRLIARKKA